MLCENIRIMHITQGTADQSHNIEEDSFYKSGHMKSHDDLLYITNVVSNAYTISSHSH